jgi:hypothetical protein
VTIKENWHVFKKIGSSRQVTGNAAFQLYIMYALIQISQIKYEFSG